MEPFISFLFLRFSPPSIFSLSLSLFWACSTWHKLCDTSNLSALVAAAQFKRKNLIKILLCFFVVFLALCSRRWEPSQRYKRSQHRLQHWYTKRNSKGIYAYAYISNRNNISKCKSRCCSSVVFYFGPNASCRGFFSSGVRVVATPYQFPCIHLKQHDTTNIFCPFFPPQTHTRTHSVSFV